jgi:hypothetical protein
VINIGGAKALILSGPGKYSLDRRDVLARQSFGPQVAVLAGATGTRGYHKAIYYASGQTSSAGR